jgi:hypothetical protein
MCVRNEKCISTMVVPNGRNAQECNIEISTTLNVFDKMNKFQISTAL